MVTMSLPACGGLMSRSALPCRRLLGRCCCSQRPAELNFEARTTRSDLRDGAEPRRPSGHGSDAGRLRGSRQRPPQPLTMSRTACSRSPSCSCWIAAAASVPVQTHRGRRRVRPQPDAGRQGPIGGSASGFRSILRRSRNSPRVVDHHPRETLPIGPTPLGRRPRAP